MWWGPLLSISHLGHKHVYPPFFDRGGQIPSCFYLVSPLVYFISLYFKFVSLHFTSFHFLSKLFHVISLRFTLFQMRFISFHFILNLFHFISLVVFISNLLHFISLSLHFPSSHLFLLSFTSFHVIKFASSFHFILLHFKLVSFRCISFLSSLCPPLLGNFEALSLLASNSALHLLSVCHTVSINGPGRGDFEVCRFKNNCRTSWNFAPLRQRNRRH